MRRPDTGRVPRHEADSSATVPYLGSSLTVLQPRGVVGGVRHHDDTHREEEKYTHSPPAGCADLSRGMLNQAWAGGCASGRGGLRVTTF